MFTKEQLEGLYRKGFSMRKIAIKLKCKESKIDYWIEKYKILKRSRAEASYYGYWLSRNKGKKLLPYTVGKKLVLKEVRNLYLKQGLSAQETGKILKRSTSSVYDFMEKSDLKRRSIAKANKLVFERKASSFSIKKNLSLQEKKLKIAGIMLYWAEGGKMVHRSDGKIRGNSVNFANSDVRMIKVFLKFLRMICRIDENRLRAHLYCYANQDIDYLKRYWQDVTSIPAGQFIKPYIRKDFVATKKDRMQYGLAHIVYSDTKLFLQIMKWVDDYVETLI